MSVPVHSRPPMGLRLLVALATVTPLIARFKTPTEDRDVRIAAADALRHYYRLDVARELVGALGAREFALAWQSRRSLRTLTGKDHRYDQGAWLGYLTNPDRPWS